MSKNKTFEINCTANLKFSLEKLLKNTHKIVLNNFDSSEVTIAFSLKETSSSYGSVESFNISELNEKEFKMLVKKMEYLNNEDIKRIKAMYNKGDNNE